MVNRESRPGRLNLPWLAAAAVCLLCIAQSAFAGTIVGWGYNNYGQATPPAGYHFVAIAAGTSHGLALKSDGSIVGWGNNRYGQATPPTGNDFVAIAAGRDHSLALKSDGWIVGWGRNNYGQATPPAGNDYVAIAAGMYHSLALKSDNSVVGWGDNDDGQATPLAGNDFVAIAAGWKHSLALKSDNSVVGWGNNEQGQATPPAGNDFVAIAPGMGHSLALKQDGSIVGWGWNPYGQASPPAGNNYIAIAAGWHHGLALKSDGSIVGWGENNHGQATPPAGNDFVAIAGGGSYSLALTFTSVIPIGVIDFNKDGIVNFSDFCHFASYLLANDTLVDIAPMPFGDGVVDAMDVAAFMDYWLEDALAIAHWKLDEAEGAIAHDDADDKDGVLHGNPTWLPNGGQIDGALELDGIGDYVSTDFVLNPADGPFSVYAWVNAGTPDQVVISQVGATGRTWLAADSEGNLMTDLRAPAGRSFGPPLVSASLITDGDWHHIALVWDGSYRHLYIDGEEVATDIDDQTTLVGTDGGLYFGAENTLSTAGFFDGIIDDIRVYDEVVTP